MDEGSVRAWRKVFEQVVASLADEAMQRRSWFGHGPEVFSPEEAFDQFLGDAAAEEFLERADNGLDPQQLEAGNILVDMMKVHARQTPQFIKPESLIDDPRWIAVRRQAAHTSQLLSGDRPS